MEAGEIKKLIDQGENDSVEFKENNREVRFVRAQLRIQ
jgi:hypothetical protein